MAVRKFAALAHIGHEQPEDKPAVEALPLPSPVMPEVESRPLGKRRVPGKRSDPRYEPTTLLLQTETKKKVNRLLEDRKMDQDLSDLAEQLLGQWFQENQL
jgi:hypothetical protein